MKNLVLSASLFAFFFCLPAHSQEPDQRVQAEAAALSWLALIDSGHAAESWDQAATLFRAAVSKQQWQGAVLAARSPLGPLRQRTHMTTEPKTSLPGAPDGQYMVLRYEGQFEYKAKALETVTIQLEKDTSWRVAGYFIQ